MTHPSGKILRIDLLAIRNGIVIGFEVKAPGFKLGWALRQARDYVLGRSVWGMVLACLVYPIPIELIRQSDRYLCGMMKLASYDRVGIGYMYGGGLMLELGGHDIFRGGRWTNQSKKYLLGQRQLGGRQSNEWQRDRFVRRF